MLSIYKKEFGENNENVETFVNGFLDTLLLLGIFFVIIFIFCILFFWEFESIFCSLKYSGVFMR